MDSRLPKSVTDFAARYPEIWSSFSALAKACHEKGGPLDEKTRRIAKLAIAIGTRHEGAGHSAVRQAVNSGISRDELIHVTLLSITTIGWPSAQAALTWIEDVVAPH